MWFLILMFMLTLLINFYVNLYSILVRMLFTASYFSTLKSALHIHYFILVCPFMGFNSCHGGVIVSTAVASLCCSAYFSCIFLCLFNVIPFLKLIPQISQWCGFSSICTFAWFFKCAAWLNAEPHISHVSSYLQYVMEISISANIYELT